MKTTIVSCLVLQLSLIWLIGAIQLGTSQTTTTKCDSTKVATDFNAACTCALTINYLICTNLTAAELHPSQSYDLSGLVLSNSLRPPVVKGAVITAQSLVILQHVALQHEGDAFKNVFAVAKKNVKISSNISTKQTFDLAALQYTELQVLNIENVARLMNLNLQNLATLTHLHLNNVTIETQTAISNINLKSSKLNHIELNGCTFEDKDKQKYNFTFSFSPNVCPDRNLNQEMLLRIELKNNPQLVGFNLETLQKSGRFYHVDLSGSRGLGAGWLKGQLSNLKKFAKDHLYLVLHDVPMQCDCDLVNWYQKQSSYIHGVECISKTGGTTVPLADFKC